MNIDDLLKEFGISINLNGLELDDSNVCRIVFDDEINIDIEADQAKENVYLHSAISKMPINNKAGFYEELLIKGLFGHGTGEASVGLDERLGEIILWRKLKCENLSLNEFSNIMEKFINAVETLSESLSKFETSTEEKTETRTLPFGGPNQGMIKA
jgi:hypothetical protein